MPTLLGHLIINSKLKMFEVATMVSETLHGGSWGAKPHSRTRHKCSFVTGVLISALEFITCSKIEASWRNSELCHSIWKYEIRQADINQDRKLFVYNSGNLTLNSFFLLKYRLQPCIDIRRKGYVLQKFSASMFTCASRNKLKKTFFSF